MRPIAILVAFALSSSSIGPTWAQVGGALNSEDVQKGHSLAVRVCGVCHVVAPDQPTQPLLAPPAPAFASIVRQRAFDEDSLTHFLTTTHRGLDNPKGMPNPELVDYQIKEIVAYVLSLYK